MAAQPAEQVIMAAKKKKALKKKTAAKKKPALHAKAKASARKPAKKAAPKKAAPKKAAPKKKLLAKKAASKGKKKNVQRQDRAGHLDPHYAAGLRRRSGKREKNGRDAFIKGSHSEDDLAQARAEEVIGKATTGEDEGEDVAQQVVDEERGGPFVVTTGGTEFADGVDESNPADAEREPFPTT